LGDTVRLEATTDAGRTASETGGREMTKCQECKKNEAEYAKQYIASDEPTYSTLGSHYRGFKVVKVCEDCKNASEQKELTTGETK